MFEVFRNKDGSSDYTQPMVRKPWSLETFSMKIPAGFSAEEFTRSPGTMELVT